MPTKPRAFALLLNILRITASPVSTQVPTTYALNPVAGATWNIQLSRTPLVSAADSTAFQIWDMDMVDTPQAVIDAFHAKGVLHR